MTSALVRGRTLNPDAVKKAKQWRENHIAELRGKLQGGTITIRERKELIFKWGIK